MALRKTVNQRNFNAIIKLEYKPQNRLVDRSLLPTDVKILESKALKVKVRSFLNNSKIVLVQKHRRLQFSFQIYILEKNNLAANSNKECGPTSSYQIYFVFVFVCYRYMSSYYLNLETGHYVTYLTMTILY